MKLFTGVRLIFSSLILIGLVLGMQACGGGGGGGSTPVPDANPTGYYTGTAAVRLPADDSATNNISDIQIMISGDRIMIMSDAQAVLYDGTFTVSGNDLTSILTIYYNGNKQAATTTLNATITAGSQLTGTFTGTNLGNGIFDSTYSNLSDTDSVQNLLGNNNWKAFINESNPLNTPASAMEFETGTSGSIGNVSTTNESVFAGCVPTGNFTPSPNSSLFEVSITFTACTTTAVDGVYTGYIQSKTTVFSEGLLRSTTFSLSVSNGTYAIADNIVRMF